MGSEPLTLPFKPMEVEPSSGSGESETESVETGALRFESIPLEPSPELKTEIVEVGGKELKVPPVDTPLLKLSPVSLRVKGLGTTVESREVGERERVKSPTLDGDVRFTRTVQIEVTSVSLSPLWVYSEW